MATPVQMPKQGNTVKECLLVEWKVQEGSAVQEGDILCGIETDKATFEVESPASGTLLKQFFPEGELVPVLTNIAAIGEAGEDVADLAPSGDGSAANEPDTPPPSPAADSPPAEIAEEPAPHSQPGPADAGVTLASPRARAAAQAKGVSLDTVSGTGPHGRILARDIETASRKSGLLTPLARSTAQRTGLSAGPGTGPAGRVRARDLIAPQSADADSPPVETPYIGIRKLIGDRMMESLNNHAQLTLNASADASNIMAFRSKIKAKAEEMGLPDITLNDMICAIAAWTLPEIPEVNGLFEREKQTLVTYRQAHLGIAVDTDRGLMVPVIRNAHAMSLGQLSIAISGVAAQCRQGSIDPDLLSGGTFTITNLGAFGIESFTPVLNTPQVAILGVGSIEQKPVPDKEKGFRFQPTIGLSLTIDHQVVDGAPAARFLKAMAEGIANFEFLLGAQAIG